MKMTKKNIILISILLVLVLCIGVGLGVGIYFQIKNSENDNTVNSFKNLESQFAFFLTGSIQLYGYSTEIASQLNNIRSIIEHPMQDLIDFMSFDSTALFVLSNELKFVPIVTNKTEFEELASINIEPNFQIVDVNFVDGNPVFVPSPERPRYCPLSYLAPNKTESLYNFLGVDLCNQTTWSGLISKFDRNINNTNIALESRFIRPTGDYVLDIGKNVYKNGVREGFAINSFFVNEFANNTLTRLFENYKEDQNVFLRIEEKVINSEDRILLFESSNFINIGTSFESVSQFRISRDITLILTFKYSADYVESFGTENDVIILCIIILLFIILDAAILFFFVLFHRKKEKERYNELERQNSYISKMINYVNHEIRNPLNSILGIIELTRMEFKQNESENKPLISNLDTAYNSCILIKHIVNDVLDVRKLEQSKLDLYPSEIDLKIFCEDLTKLLQPKIQENIHINFEIQCNVDKIYTDSSRLTQILLNLVTNAFKFTHNGSITLNINEQSGSVLFEVVDTGIGVSPENEIFLFKPFSQLEKDQVSRTGGYGLGLYLCRMLAVLMQGEIGYRKNQGSGSTFWFYLPKIYKNSNIN